MRKGMVTLGVSVLTCALLFACCRSSSGQAREQVVRLAELEIDPEQLQNYKEALREEIATSIRVEPGVLTLYAVALKDNPAQIRLFEVYANMAAYQAHLRTPHFLKYKAGTQGMVKSLRLLETEPILLGTRER